MKEAIEFTKSPFIAGKNVSLRSLLPADLEGAYFRWFNDSEVCRHNSHGRFPNSLARMQAYVDEVSRSRSQLVLAIMENSSGRHVGNIALQNIQWIDRTAEYAIVLGERDTWGKGFAKEASDLILRHGFLELNLHRIYCGTSADNLAMQKLAKHMGMEEGGRRREAVYKAGKHQDVLEYGILRSEFLKS